MWKLNPEADGGAPNYFVPGEKYTVGRKNCSVLLQNDQSISRDHAQLALCPASLPNGASTLTLTDSSKYGTFVNGEKLEKNVAKTLKAGDQLTFGVFHSKFRVEFEALLVCSSCVDSEGKGSLAKDVQTLGGKLINSWSKDCTHLVMPAVKVTIKTICALLCSRPIVKPEFFSEFRRALQDKSPPPKVEQFCPEIDEPTLPKDVDLSSKPERKSLFQGKTFVFFSLKQLKRLSSVVEFGGGRALLLEEGSLPIALLESAQSCVVDMAMGSSQPPLTEAAVQWCSSVSHVLQRKGLRMITESEIGLATIYVTTEMYCNPSAQMKPDTTVPRPTLPSATLSQNVTVDETMLPAISQNITAYAPDTELTQDISRLDTSGPCAVGETPEKDRRQNGSSSKRPAAANTPRLLVPALADDTAAMSTKDRSERVAPGPRHGSDSRTSQACPSIGGNKSRSPPKQPGSLTHYFQPVSKKRSREGGDLTNQSEAKISRREEVQQQEEVEEESSSAVPQRSNSKKNSPASLNQESSLSGSGEGDTLSQAQDARSDLDHLSDATSDRPMAGKRKEMAQTVLETCLYIDDDDDLESIMSTPMEDLDQQGADSKRRRTEPSTDIKQEELSLTVACTERDGIIPHTSKTEPQSSAVKPNVKDLKAVLKPEFREDLPRNVLVVQFKSLVVDSSQRPRLGRQPLQMVPGKNFKQFRKVPVPGSSGLPNIIGGSDLIAHNRAKNSELEEWLREAAQEDSRNEREDTLGDDLFRYNPKPSRRR